MGLARFVAKDPYTPRATKKELAELISDMHGIIDWSIQANGEVTVEYNHTMISDQVIEEALNGMGFKLKHIFDEPHADEAEAEEVLSETNE